MKFLAGIGLMIYLMVKSSGQPVSLRQGSELFVSEVVRVRRQAGYVYDKPSVSFDLPDISMTTQAPTVDRTQAQMMYYAYPVPASGGNSVSGGISAGASAGGGAASSATRQSAAGYSYGAQNGRSNAAQGTVSTGSSQVGSTQTTGSGANGYGYDAPSAGIGPVSTGSPQASNGGSSGYGYNAPSNAEASFANGGQTSSVVNSAQANSAGFAQTGSSVSAAGYDYNVPTNSQVSGTAPATEVSTSAPKYLPPIPGGGDSSDVKSDSVSTGVKGSYGSISNGSPSIIQPVDQYLPPPVSNPPSPAQPTDQYIPPSNPSTQIDSSVTTGSSGPAANQAYIPPDRGQSSAGNATPRPFAPAPPPRGYLPPSMNPLISATNPSTPAPSYLPPLF